MKSEAIDREVTDDLGFVNYISSSFIDQNDSRPPMYEETTGRQMEDSSGGEEEEEKEPPPEPPRFGWIQGVMVGGVWAFWQLFMNNGLSILMCHVSASVHLHPYNRNKQSTTEHPPAKDYF